MLREPIVRLMMERDGIVSGDVRQIMQKVQSARALKGRRQPATTMPMTGMIRDENPSSPMSVTV
ncbi:MAG TPA: hypothetical protein VMP03_16885 [Methylomirabilota bacterium]|nr:hypothetical protein [Methylomirabilota bacterium]